MEQEYYTVKKGTGILYVCADVLYHRVRTVGNVKYLKCNVTGCNGSAKLVGEQFYLGVSNNYDDMLRYVIMSEQVI